MLLLDIDATLAGEVKNPGLGPLHTEFDGKGYAYTSFFISSEVVKWKLGTWEVVDRVPTYYSVGHLMIPGGGTMKPNAKYLVAMDKITKDRYLPTGPELTQSAQLIDISGDKMQLLYDMPLPLGEPHYVVAIDAKKLKPAVRYKVGTDSRTDKPHPGAVRAGEEKTEKKGNKITVYGTLIRSH